MRNLPRRLTSGKTPADDGYLIAHEHGYAQKIVVTLQ